MKKEYMTPHLSVIEVKESLIVATSGGLNNGDPVGNRVVDGGSDNEFIQSAYGWDDED